MTYQAKITSKGQITLPVELRSALTLIEGDTVEFFFDHTGRVCMRPRHSSASRFLDALPQRQPSHKYSSDDDAIAAAVIAKDARSRRVRGTKRK